MNAFEASRRWSTLYQSSARDEGTIDVEWYELLGLGGRGKP